MAIERRDFDNELELQTWVEKHIFDFFGDVIFIPGNFIISTKRNKGAKPDGFILDLANSSWTIIESELLHHGVWDHIAEQIVRFIVAAKNDSTQRKVRDLFFNVIEQRKLISELSSKNKISESRIVQKIETIIESQTPDIAIFIDEINEDLEDMVEALNATIKVFRIQKYFVNGSVEYLSPAGSKSVLETSIEEVKDTSGKQMTALDVLGGGSYVEAIGSLKFYKLNDGSLISIKFSKKYDSDPPFWYGITPRAISKYKELRIGYLIFIMGEEGLLKLPLVILLEYIEQANKSLTPDGSIKHYHIFIKLDKTVILYTNQTKRTWDVTSHYYKFD